MSKINEKAMLVNLNISTWTARKLDKKATETVAREYATSGIAGRYNKILIAQEEIRKVEQAVGKMRAFHAENTLPWNQDGSRMLPSANYFEYVTAMNALRDEAQIAVGAFILLYPVLVEDARLRLNGLFNAADYPSPDRLASKFAFKIRFLPVPVSDDFRVTLGDEDINKIKQAIQNDVNDAFEAANRELWQRTYDAAKRMRDRLDACGTPGTRFHDSAVDNVRDLCNLLPRLNVSNDPELDMLRLDIERDLLKYQASELKEDNGYRGEIIEAADDILKRMMASGMIK